MADDEMVRTVTWANRLLGLYLGVIVVALVMMIALPRYSDTSPDSTASSTAQDPALAGARRDLPILEAETEVGAQLGTSAIDAGESGAAQPDTAQANAEVRRRPAASESTAQSDLGIAAINFDLGEGSASANAPARLDGERIQVRKPVYANGVELGLLAVTIDKNARLYAQKGDLKALMANDAANSSRIDRLKADGLVSFQRLREFGVSLRYDPIADHIVLQPG